MKLLMILLGASLAAQASRQISRIVFQHYGSCHHGGGSTFSLMTYADIRPWAEAVKEEVLARRMPPWGAVKGFGDFRNDRALTAEQLEWIGSWANGGVPEGGIAVSGEFMLKKPLIAKNATFQITAHLPGGRVEPLVWLSDSFLLRWPLELPAGTVIRGVPSDAMVTKGGE